MDKQMELFGTKTVVPGSAASIVAEQKKARELKQQRLINDMKSDFPQLARMYDALKEKVT